MCITYFKNKISQYHQLDLLLLTITATSYVENLSNNFPKRPARTCVCILPDLLVASRNDIVPPGWKRSPSGNFSGRHSNNLDYYDPVRKDTTNRILLPSLPTCLTRALVTRYVMCNMETTDKKTTPELAVSVTEKFAINCNRTGLPWM